MEQHMIQELKGKMNDQFQVFNFFEDFSLNCCLHKPQKN